MEGDEAKRSGGLFGVPSRRRHVSQKPTQKMKTKKLRRLMETVVTGLIRWMSQSPPPRSMMLVGVLQLQ